MTVDMANDVLGVGNAILDILVPTDESFLKSEGMTKGAMALIDEVRAASIYAAIGAGVEVSGGSAANTIVGVASFGGKVTFVGKVKSDPIGEIYSDNIRASNVKFTTKPAQDGPATGCSYVLITSDGQRTMNTYLGAAQFLRPADIVPEDVTASKIIYLEGYLWDTQDAKSAFMKAAEIAHGVGRKVAFTLSDSSCVGRYRSEFLQLIRNKTVDIVFSNESEVCSLYEADLAAAIRQLREDVELGVVTRSEKGCVVVDAGRIYEIAARPVHKAVDTTGAGDLFAAGVLFGVVRNLGSIRAGELGCLAASSIIQHLGARPQKSLAVLAQENGVLP